MGLKKHWVLLTAFLLVTLGGSILLNVLLYDRARKYYVELNQTRLDPLGVSAFPSHAKNEAGHPFRVVFFGDSRAASWIDPDLSGVEFVNRGIGSQTSIQVRDRFSAHVRPLAPNLVLIQVGINDLKTIALFPDQKASIIANCQANIKRIVEDSKSIGATVIVTTIFPVGEVPLERRPVWSDAIAEAVNEVNAYIATLADDQVIVFDAFSMLADGQGKMVRNYEVDELHLNPQGYAVLNQELVKQVQAVKQRRVGK
jgi:lysophospholipase L1-like esterase